MKKAPSEAAKANADRLVVSVFGKDSTILKTDAQLYRSEEGDGFVSSVTELAVEAQEMPSGKVPGYCMGHDLDPGDRYPALYFIVSLPKDILDALMPALDAAILDAMRRVPPEENPKALSLATRMSAALEVSRAQPSPFVYLNNRAQLGLGLLQAQPALGTKEMKKTVSLGRGLTVRSLSTREIRSAVAESDYEVHQQQRPGQSARALEDKTGVAEDHWKPPTSRINKEAVCNPIAIPARKAQFRNPQLPRAV